jgi:hypothetical protein
VWRAIERADGYIGDVSTRRTTSETYVLTTCTDPTAISPSVGFAVCSDGASQYGFYFFQCQQGKTDAVS